MINLRYHIVSITAVFLALGIGLTLGSTFLDRVTVDTLKNQVDTVEAQVRETRAENEELGRRVDALEERDDALAEELPERLFGGHLDAVPVLVVAARGTDEELVDATVAAVAAGGAEVAGTWWLTDRWALDDADEADELAALLDLRSDDPDRLRRNGAIQMSELLLAASQPPPPPEAPDAPVDGQPAPEGSTPTIPAEPLAPDANEPPLVASLEEAGFLDYETLPGAAGERVLLPGASARYVVVSGALPDTGAHLFATALLEEIVAEGVVPVVAAQPEVDLRDAEAPASEEARRGTFVGALRESELTRDRLSTVDHLDTAAGLTAVVLALEDLEEGRTGHYGVGSGAARLLPGADAET